jgi:hypothetical protein
VLKVVGITEFTAGKISAVCRYKGCERPNDGLCSTGCLPVVALSSHARDSVCEPFATARGLSFLFFLCPTGILISSSLDCGSAIEPQDSSMCLYLSGAVRFINHLVSMIYSL